MVLTVRDLINDPSRISEMAPRAHTCSVCGLPIIEQHHLFSTEYVIDWVRGKPVHAECFHDELIDLIDEHPIGGARVRWR